MKDLFDIRRFGFVLVKDFRENGKRYLLLFLTMVGIIFIVHALQANSDYTSRYKNDIDTIRFLNKTLLVWSSFLFMGMGLIFSSTLMEPMNSKTKRISFLSLPASHLEKYLSRWLIVTVLYAVMFFVALWLADVCRVAVFSIRYSPELVQSLDLSKLIDFNSDNSSSAVIPYKGFLIGLSVFLLLQSICVLGSTFWEKASFIKTAAVLVASGFVVFYLLRLVIFLFYPDYNDFAHVMESFELDKLQEATQLTLAMTFLLFFTLVNWVLAFFRFRESEIIKRW